MMFAESEDSHDSHDSHDESSSESPIRAKDEEPTEVHGGDESEQAGGSGAGPEGDDAADAHNPRPEQDDE